MRILQINYDEDENIKNITVNMTEREAVALTNILGNLNGYAHQKLNIDSDMYDCMSATFNRHNEDGVKSLHIDLKTLNEPTHE